MIGIPDISYQAYWMLQKLTQQIPVLEKYGFIKEGIDFNIFPQELSRLEEEFRNGNFGNVLQGVRLIFDNWVKQDAFYSDSPMDANAKACCEEVSKLECNRTRL